MCGFIELFNNATAHAACEFFPKTAFLYQPRLTFRRYYDFIAALCNSPMYCVTHVTGIEDLCAKRDELHRQTLVEEEEKTRIQNDIRILTERLAKVNESLAKKMAQRNEFDKTIAETEAAYMKVDVELYLMILTSF